MKNYSPQRPKEHKRHRGTEKNKAGQARIWIHAIDPARIILGCRSAFRPICRAKARPTFKVFPRRINSLLFSVFLSLLCPSGYCGSGFAAPAELGRLFYTPVQRAQLESARTHSAVSGARPGQAPGADSAPVPLRFDGVVIRSDGKSTRWVDGKPQVGTSSVSGLKPGQIRADGKVYEPYQVLRPVSPNAAGAGAGEMESTP